ncbi:MAG: NAD(P)H-dependent oxidoreductase [Nitrososphaeraceae archaeon]
MIFKNTIEYASNPYDNNPFDEKPVAIISASIGMLGGARAHSHLFMFLNIHPIKASEVKVNLQVACVM